MSGVSDAVKNGVREWADIRFTFTYGSSTTDASSPTTINPAGQDSGVPPLPPRKGG